MTMLLRIVAWIAFGIGAIVAIQYVGTLVTQPNTLTTVLVLVTSAAIYGIGGLLTWALLTVCAEALDYFARQNRKSP